MSRPPDLHILETQYVRNQMYGKPNIIGLPIYWVSNILGFQYIWFPILGFQYIGFPVYWVSNILGFQYTGFPIYWVSNIGFPIYWVSNKLGFQYTGFPVYWVYIILGLQYTRFPIYSVSNILSFQFTGFPIYWVPNMLSFQSTVFFHILGFQCPTQRPPHQHLRLQHIAHLLICFSLLLNAHVLHGLRCKRGLL